MTTKLEQVRQNSVDAQQELERVLIEETDERPALVLRVDAGDSLQIIKRITRKVSEVDEDAVTIFDDEIAVVISVLTAMKKSV